MLCPKFLSSLGVRRNQEKGTVIIITKNNAGTNLLILPSKKLERLNEYIDFFDIIRLDIKYPLITKKTSTPTYPPLKNSNPAWKKITIKTATARRLSISGRYWILMF